MTNMLRSYESVVNLRYVGEQGRWRGIRGRRTLVKSTLEVQLMSRARVLTALLVFWAASAAPLAAQNITNVVETGGDNEATDTITAKWTGQTFSTSVANEPVTGAIGTGFTV